MTSLASVDAAQPPSWFLAAIDTPPDVGATDVRRGHDHLQGLGGTRPRQHRPVHGGAAHARWWDHIAPLLAGGHRVAALDLSGHGDSGRRDRYNLDVWAEEVLAVAAAAGIEGPPVVIGHSMGGFVTLRAASVYGSRLAGAVAIDSPVRDLTLEEQAAREHRAFGPCGSTRPGRLPFPGSGPSRTSPCCLHRQPRGRHLDPRGRRRLELEVRPPHLLPAEPAPALLTRVDCRVALFRAEHGMVSSQMGEVMYDRLGRVAPVIEVPAAGHHVMLDQPIALVTGIRTLLSDWDHSLPAAPPPRRRSAPAAKIKITLPRAPAQRPYEMLQTTVIVTVLPVLHSRGQRHRARPAAAVDQAGLRGHRVCAGRATAR